MTNEANKIKNILILGLIGVGKSSLLYCLSNMKIPMTEASTTEFQSTLVKHNETTYKLFKPPSINETNQVKVVEHIANTIINLNQVCCFQQITILI